MKTFEDLISKEDEKKYYGFIYRIDFDDGKFYIGQKSFKKGLDWKTYQSSSKSVKEKLKKESAKFSILKLCKTKGELSYEETKRQFIENCLESTFSMCENIAGRYFRSRVEKYVS